MIPSRLKVIGLAAFGAITLVMSANGASAMPLAPSGQSVLPDFARAASNVELTGGRRAYRRGYRQGRRRGYRQGRRRGYRRHVRPYHGKRYRHRRYGYNHFYGGYWYPFAWWLGTAAIVAANRPAAVYNDDGHVNWCLRKYRSYNPRTDMYLAYSGRYRPCISPYSY